MFFSATTPESFLKRIGDQALGSRPEAWGTLLPFHRGVKDRPTSSQIQNYRFPNDHSTVKCWTVESDGSVTITSAAIIASTADTSDFDAAIYGPDVVDPRKWFVPPILRICETKSTKIRHPNRKGATRRRFGNHSNAYFSRLKLLGKNCGFWNTVQKLHRSYSNDHSMSMARAVRSRLMPPVSERF